VKALGADDMTRWYPRPFTVAARGAMLDDMAIPLSKGDLAAVVCVTILGSAMAAVVLWRW
jgi:hypothetical protein